jgi:penicillin-insensitive murein DD-endopeptidase
MRLALLATVTLLAGWISFGNDLTLALESSARSRSIGTPSHGRLEHGKRLPSRGPNFRAYSRLGTALGRNSVHSQVRAVVLATYAEMVTRAPGARFVYGETGWPSGGRFRPHRTHQNGLSVDFMVPVRTRSGAPAELPTWPWQKFGYGIEFDSMGRWRDLEIDYQAIAAHLTALDAAARRYALHIERVIFAPEQVRRLAAVPGGRAVVERLPFMRARPWVRHDEHYHVDFSLLP